MHLSAVEEVMKRKKKSDFLCGQRDIAEKIWQALTRIAQDASPCLEGSEQFCLTVLKRKEELKPEESREASQSGESLQS